MTSHDEKKERAMKIQSMKALEAEMRAVARGEIDLPAEAKLPSVEPARVRDRTHTKRHRGDQ
jgi:hypothetical protein